MTAILSIFYTFTLMNPIFLFNNKNGASRRYAPKNSQPQLPPCSHSDKPKDTNTEAAVLPFAEKNEKTSHVMADERFLVYMLQRIWFKALISLALCALVIGSSNPAAPPAAASKTDKSALPLTLPGEGNKNIENLMADASFAMSGSELDKAAGV